MSEFDQHSSDYVEKIERTLPRVGKKHQFFVAAKVRALLRVCRRHWSDLSGKSVLDVGCGIGTTLRELQGHFAVASGVDLSKESVEVARQSAVKASVESYDGRRLPYGDRVFDVVYTICVMHHVPPAQWLDFLREMARVVKPDGLLFVFEHNPFNPLTRKAVADCPFDEGVVLFSQAKARQLFEAAGIEVLERRHILFLPFEGRLIDAVEAVLAPVPLGAQYYLVGRPRA